MTGQLWRRKRKNPEFRSPRQLWRFEKRGGRKRKTTTTVTLKLTNRYGGPPSRKRTWRVRRRQIVPVHVSFWSAGATVITIIITLYVLGVVITVIIEGFWAIRSPGVIILCRVCEWIPFVLYRAHSRTLYILFRAPRQKCEILHLPLVLIVSKCQGFVPCKSRYVYKFKHVSFIFLTLSPKLYYVMSNILKYVEFWLTYYYKLYFYHHRDRR